MNANMNMPTSQIKKPTVKSRLKSGANIDKLNPTIAPQNQRGPSKDMPSDRMK